ncbi:MAG: chondroitinase family polysaccharide lyase [Paludibacter sp.]|nr:chondroitinase family polysaccharide lyase [Paludibacter sp.]MDD4428288.1 chondroitinase family polysaccharide lyase [Paludibacter sp.]
MRFRLSLCSFLFLVFLGVLNAQQYSFDSGSMAPFQPAEPAKAQLSLVNVPYKNGNAALQWNWTAPTSLMIDYQVTLKNFRDGVIFWVYNETPGTTPLRGEFRDTNNNVRYYFNFGMNFSGWRICRIGSRYMLGNKSVSANLKLHLLTPSGVNQGRLFIDRFSFVSDVGYQNAPDAQQPDNTEAGYINHWNSLWKWESELTYDLPLPASLTETQLTSLQSIEEGIDKRLPQSASSSAISTAKKQFNNANIRKEGGFWVGAPLVVKPDKGASDISLAELGTMMYGLALDALFNNNQTSLQQYLDLWDYAHSQGFAYGSAMGNNHHYGYETRQIFQSAFMMREALDTSGKLDEVAATLSFWSGLPESRRAFDMVREGVVDTWNTLLFPRLIAAMLIRDLPQRYRAVNALVRWVDSSFAYTPGNLGGFKRDGTVFHHAGHYPAYAVGGFEGIGDFISTLPASSFNLSLTARKNFAESLFAMSRYTHFTDWSIGLSGRHPHQGSMTSAVIESFGLLSLLGGVYDTNESIDSKLAGAYLRLETVNTPLKQQLSSYPTGDLPSGFFVYNHAAAGVHRLGNSMVTIKGYNSDVWGSEIYTNDNRYGRYQSYGAVEIFNEGTPVSRRNSRFNQAGWDWNRLPGTTTIHLPLNLLESPVTSTLMARSKEDFAGASSLSAEFGIFGMKLWEENLINNTNYTRDFKARKSVFVFGKRLVCIGTDISNSNASYPTETTLYQQTINTSTDQFVLDGNAYYALGYNVDSQISSEPTVLSDISGNYYRLTPPYRIIIEGKEQVSKHDKTRIETRGNFLTARIDHGKSPAGARYEYMIMLKPNPLERIRWSGDPAYRVWQADAAAHIVHDTISRVTGYVAYQTIQPTKGIVKQLSAESLLMLLQTDDVNLVMSVCDPSLHLPEKTNNSENTLTQSAQVVKEIILEGNWRLKNQLDNVTISLSNGQTLLSVKCQYGIPVEFEMQKIDTATDDSRVNKLNISSTKNRLEIDGYTESVTILDITGTVVAFKDYSSEKKTFFLTENRLYLLVARLSDNTLISQKVIL